MTAGPPAGTVDGRTLARWHARLAPLRPQSLWVGSLGLLHVEAAVRVARPAPLDPLHRHLLAAIAATPGATAAVLDARLRLGPALGRWLDELRAGGLIHIDGGQCVVTPRGGQALATGTAPFAATERRRFTFVTPGPHYLPWVPVPGPHDPAVGVADAGWVADCVARPAEWKRRAGFPEAVEEVDLPEPNLPPAAAWRRLAVARSERVPVVLAVMADGALAGFVPDAAGGLNIDSPALRMSEGWADIFPELAGAADESAAGDVGNGWRLVGEGRLRRAVLDSL